MESIDSDEVVALPVAKLADGPTHTNPDHANCAYYLHLFRSDWDGASKSEYATLICRHNSPATGGFYSEDYVKAIKAAAHQVLAAVDRYPGIKAQKKWVETLRELTK